MTIRGTTAMRRPTTATLAAVIPLVVAGCAASTVTVTSTSQVAVTSTQPGTGPLTTGVATKSHKEALERACEEREAAEGKTGHLSDKPLTPACLARRRAIFAHDAAEEKRVNEAYAASPEGKRRAKLAVHEAKDAARKARDGAPDAALFERVEHEGEVRRQKLAAEGGRVGLTTESELTAVCEEAARNNGSWTVDTEVECGEPARHWVEEREAERR